MTSKLTITDERIEKIAVWLATESHSLNLEMLTCLRELQERRKAEKDSEPVAYTDEEELNFVNDMACMWTKGMGINEVPLYRHAQTAPVVVGDGRDQFEEWMLKKWGRERQEYDFAMGKLLHGENYADSYTRHMWKAWSASRSAMLNGGKS